MYRGIKIETRGGRKSMKRIKIRKKKTHFNTCILTIGYDIIFSHNRMVIDQDIGTGIRNLDKQIDYHHNNQNDDHDDHDDHELSG